MSEEAQNIAQALLDLVRRLEEENAQLKTRIVELESRTPPPLPPPARQEGVIRAKASAVQRPEEGPNARAVVRGKREREAMQGFQCGQCQEFYDALGVRPHKCSKHKLHRPPPDTPDGFWEPWGFD